MGEGIHTTKTIELRVPSEASYLQLLREFVVGVAEQIGCNTQDAGKIEICLDEACSSLLDQIGEIQEEEKPAPPGGHVEKFIITIGVSSSGISIAIVHPARVLDFDHITQDVEGSLSHMKLRELGAYLIKTFMDEVTYKTNPEGSTELVMVKHLK